MGVRTAAFALSLFGLAGCAGSASTGDGTAQGTATASAGSETTKATTLAWPRDDLPGTEAYRVQIPIAGAPARGADEPLVTIVAFSDFECPFCKRVVPTIEQLLKTYPRDVRFVFRHYPLPRHAIAEPAARVAVEIFRTAGAAAFWRAHDVLFAEQADLSVALLEKVAAEAKVDAKRVRAIVEGTTHADVVAADKALGTSAGVDGTPAFFINGRLVSGAQPYEVFLRLVNEERALARVAMERGTPRSSLYEAVLSIAEPPHRSEEAPETPEPQAKAAPRAEPAPRYKVSVEANEPMRGGKAPLVTIVMYSDFECPFCARVEPTLLALLERYGSDLRLVYRHLPLPSHAHAMGAAEAASEAYAQKGASGFWTMHRLLLDHRQELGQSMFEQLAKEAGLDLRRFRKALDRGVHRSAVEKQVESARRFGVTGTPAFFINGVPLVGARPPEDFAEVIEREKARAAALVAEGVPREKVYDAAIRDGLEQARGAAADDDDDDSTRHKLAIPKRAPQRGPDDAPVVIHLFSDFECPYCARARATVDRIVRAYPKAVRVVWRHYPLSHHPNAMAAAHAASEVFAQLGNDAFWQYHDLLFDHQQTLDAEAIERLATQIRGLDLKRFRKAVREGAHRTPIEADMRALTETGAAVVTPSFFVNGVHLPGAQPFSVFKRKIDAEIAAQRPGAARR